MANLLEYKCPCCGGAIQFDTSIQKMKCPYCSTEFDVETLRSYDKDLNDTKEVDMSWNIQAGKEWGTGEQEGMLLYVCKSCGGQIVTDPTTSATSCPFCNNPVVIMGQLTGTLKPDLVIPFKFDKNAAKEGLKNHLKGKKLLPKVFKDENHIDEIKGVYVPFWLFDADADANMRFRGTKTRMWSDGRANYTETSYYSIVRGGSLSFEVVPVDGSSKIANDLMESIEPFNMADAVDFQTAYLAGFLADKYDVTSEECSAIANERIKHSTEQAFASTVSGFTSVTQESANIQLKNASAKYALYPVWLLNTSWNGQKYTFAMNGQTGKFVGDLPVDKGAAWKYFFLYGGITAAVIAGITALVTLF